MKYFIVALFFVLTSSTAVYAEEPPLDFKGIALGTDISAIKNTSKFSCRDVQGPIADQVCHLNFDENETIAGVPVELLVLYFFSKKLENISIEFNSESFFKVVAALKEKYGPGEVRSEVVQNRMGATFENEIYSWSRGKAGIEARRYSRKIDTSSVNYHTDFAIEEFERRRSSTTKENADDL
jgi:hypothetical protein